MRTSASHCEEEGWIAGTDLPPEFKPCNPKHKCVQFLIRMSPNSGSFKSCASSPLNSQSELNFRVRNSRATTLMYGRWKKCMRGAHRWRSRTVTCAPHLNCAVSKVVKGRRSRTLVIHFLTPDQNNCISQLHHTRGVLSPTDDLTARPLSNVHTNDTVSQTGG
jgi:hypothetical protein